MEYEPLTEPSPAAPPPRKPPTAVAAAPMPSDESGPPGLPGVTMPRTFREAIAEMMRGNTNLSVAFEKRPPLLARWAVSAALLIGAARNRLGRRQRA
jgi:hypothetical protein